MHDNKTNGTLSPIRVFAVGAKVKVMPRSMANICAQNAGAPLRRGNYTVASDLSLWEVGYTAFVRESPTEVGGKYTLRTPLGTFLYDISGISLYGVDYAIGDVVEVSPYGTPGVPPARRVFLGYGFNARFTPQILTYSEDDSIAILEDVNSATVNLGEAEGWDFDHPAENLLAPEHPVYEIDGLTKNGRSISVSSMSRADWCGIYDDAL